MQSDRGRRDILREKWGKVSKPKGQWIYERKKVRINEMIRNKGETQKNEKKERRMEL